jgi:hypothetical protein
MTQLIKYRYLTLLMLGLALLLSGCGRRVSISEEKPVLQEVGLYEIFWVDPQIVVVDSLITLIRSERIDSAVVEPVSMTIHRPAAVGLRIAQPTCHAMVDLLDSNLRLIRPLLMKKLGYGFYRLTLNVDRFREPSLPPGRYFLRAEFCGRSEMAMFTAP